MTAKLLAKDRLSAVVAALMADCRLYAPVRRDGELRFDAVASAGEVVLDYRNTRRSPKALLVPQTGSLLRYSAVRDDLNRVDVVPLDATPTAILGLRPCDARGYLFLDLIFAEGQYRDPYYIARRENTLVVALACDWPRRTCFCHAFESGPYDRAGADVFLREAGDAYLAEAVTEAGAALLAALDLPDADEAHERAATESEARAVARLEPIAPVAGIEDALEPLFNDPVWREIAEKCVACGTCTYNCPDCHCFQVQDRELAAGGERIRVWDGCMFPGFTLHASGHNPRPDQAARWRQRVMHKFSYLPENVGLYGCVGCGRCIQSCPVQLDIRAVLARLRAAAAEKAAAAGKADPRQATEGGRP